MISDLRS